MKPFLILLLPIALTALFSCSSSKKSVQTPLSNTAAEPIENTKNPTLKKLTAGMLDENTFLLEGISDDPTYGYDKLNAIKVSGGPTNEKKYMNALLGPNGESITYNRRGSCCAVLSTNGLMGYAVLDIYEIKYEGLEKPIVIYLNMYDPGFLKAPMGLTFRKQ